MKEEELKNLIKKVVQETASFSKGTNFQKDCAAADTPYRITDQKIDIAGMYMRAKKDNAGLVYWGFDKYLSAANGTEMEARDWIWIPIDRADKIWILAANAADGVCVACLV